MNHSSQLWLNRSRSLITIPPDNSPRSLTFSTRINRLIRYQRIIISLSNYLISSNKYFIGQQYSSQFRIRENCTRNLPSLRNSVHSSIVPFFFFFLLHKIFADRSSVKGFGEQCRNAIKCASLIERYSSSFRNVVFREMTLGKNRCWPPHLHTFVGHEYRDTEGEQRSLSPIVFDVAFLPVHLLSRGKNVIFQKFCILDTCVCKGWNTVFKIVENSYIDNFLNEIFTFRSYSFSRW